MSLFGPTLAGSAGQGGADLGDTIEQSLRFTGSQYLTGPTGTTTSTFTFSAWVKKAFLQTNRTSGYILGLNTNGNGLGFYTDQLSQSSPAFYSAARYRDPSAWYHVVANTTGQYWINGEAVPNSPASLKTPSNDAFVIGTLYPAQASSYGWVGQIAQVYLVDGQEIGPTNFGKYNEDGVWVPQDYTGSYGTNGIHLKFDSSGYNGSGGIGADHSGNGNDFTAYGSFDTADVALWSSQVFTTGYLTQDFTSTRQNFNSTQPPTGSFDGNGSTAGQSAGGNDDSTYFVRFTTPIQNVTSIEMKPTNGSGYQYHYINGTQGTFSSGGVKQTIYSGTAITLETVGVNWISSNAGSGFYQLWVNGTELIDNTDNDVDYFDTPTSNYSTYNPLVNNDEPTFNQANLDADSFNNGIAWATQELPNKHLYCEFVKTAGDRFAAGVWDAEDKFEKGAANDNDYAFGIVYSEFAALNRIYNESTTASQTGLTAYNTGDVLGVEWRGDLATRQVNFYINGTQVGTSENVAAGGRYYFGAHRAGGSTGPSVQVNYGQMPFLAAPAGVTNTTHGMQTNNLDKPTIKNGSDHFRALTGTGANILAIAQGTNTSGTNWNPDVDTGFTNGLWWIKDRANANQHQFVNSIFGTSQVQQCPGLSSTTYSAPSGSSVAWCWNAPDTFTGTTGTTCRVNEDAGFSIVTISTALSSYLHGLGDTPDWVLVKNHTAQNFMVWHSSLPGQYLALDAVNGAASAAPGIFPSDPNSTTVSLGSSLTSTGFDAYHWRAVPGYSAFGSYVGNGNADGAFVYTGIRISFLLIKRHRQW